jgi:6-phosphogluconolactonase
VTVFPSDERCVPHDDPACNLRALRAAFDEAEGLRLRPLTTADGDPDRSEHEARSQLAQCPQPWDALVLGMGADGHTASLFPGAPQLAAALASDGDDDACRVDPRPLPAEAPYPRITLTVPRLLRARIVHLAITGAAKRAVLHEALKQNDPLQHPVAAILHAAATSVEVHWSP